MPVVVVATPLFGILFLQKSISIYFIPIFNTFVRNTPFRGVKIETTEILSDTIIKLAVNIYVFALS